MAGEVGLPTSPRGDRRCRHRLRQPTSAASPTVCSPKRLWWRVRRTNIRVGVGALFYEDGVWNVTTFGIAKAEPPQNFAQMLRPGRRDTARALFVRAAAGHPARRDGVPQVPDQSLAPLRQTRPLPRRHLPVRRRRRQLQSHLRAGDDDDGDPGRQPADGDRVGRSRHRSSDSRRLRPRRRTRCG